MTSRLARVLVFAAVAALLAVPAANAQVAALPSAPVDAHNMTLVANVPSLSGNALDFFERQLPNGTIKRYAVAANVGNGFDILDLTEPTAPVVAGRYLLPGNDPSKLQQSSLGSNFHAWVSVNPRRNIVALTTEEGVAGAPLGHTLRHGGAVGLQLVDISDVTNPRPLGKIDGLDGPHTVRMIGDNHAYTSLNTWAVDYTDPMHPTATKPGIEGHEFFEDPNVPGRMYVGLASSVFRWGVFDITNPGLPQTVTTYTDSPPRTGAAHEAYPAADSSFVGVADFTNGQLDTTCPGGGVHFYDISGHYQTGATVTAPRKLGAWFAPTTGLSSDSSQTTPNNASCTMHSWQPNPERMIAVAGLYSGGTFVFDPSSPTQPGGAYTEYQGARGKTTWGNTLGHVRDAGDYVNAAQWLPFDLDDPADERLIYVNGGGRGLDIYRYTGPLPPKQALLRVDGTSSGGVVHGTLVRCAVQTYAGWRNLPLAGRTVQVTAGGQTVTVTTGADGSFAAPLALGSGPTTVTATWAGDASFDAVAATATVAGQI